MSIAHLHGMVQSTGRSGGNPGRRRSISSRRTQGQASLKSGKLLSLNRKITSSRSRLACLSAMCVIWPSPRSVVPVLEPHLRPGSIHGVSGRLADSWPRDGHEDDEQRGLKGVDLSPCIGSASKCVCQSSSGGYIAVCNPPASGKTPAYDPPLFPRGRHHVNILAAFPYRVLYCLNFPHRCVPLFFDTASE